MEIRSSNKEIGIKNLIRLQKKDFASIKSQKIITHFNLEKSNHEINMVYLLPKILSSGYYISESDFLEPELDFENCYVAKCLEVRENLSYDDLSEKDFQYSFENIKNIETLKKEILFRYSKSLPNLSKEEILNLGISLTKLEILGKLKNE